MIKYFILLLTMTCLTEVSADAADVDDVTANQAYRELRDDPDPAGHRIRQLMHAKTMPVKASDTIYAKTGTVAPFNPKSLQDIQDQIQAIRDKQPDDATIKKLAEEKYKNARLAKGHRIEKYMNNFKELPSEIQALLIDATPLKNQSLGSVYELLKTINESLEKLNQQDGGILYSGKRSGTLIADLENLRDKVRLQRDSIIQPAEKQQDPAATSRTAKSSIEQERTRQNKALVTLLRGQGPTFSFDSRALEKLKKQKPDDATVTARAQETYTTDQESQKYADLFKTLSPEVQALLMKPEQLGYLSPADLKTLSNAIGKDVARLQNDSADEKLIQQVRDLQSKVKEQIDDDGYVENTLALQQKPFLKSLLLHEKNIADLTPQDILVTYKEISEKITLYEMYTKQPAQILRVELMKLQAQLENTFAAKTQLEPKSLPFIVTLPVDLQTLMINHHKPIPAQMSTQDIINNIDDIDNISPHLAESEKSLLEALKKNLQKTLRSRPDNPFAGKPKGIATT